MQYILRRPRAFWISVVNLLGLACSMVGVVMLSTAAGSKKPPTWKNLNSTKKT
jgi:hypothetical protein